MTAVMVFATQDGYLQSVNSSYPAAKAGTSAASYTAGTTLVTGQNFAGGAYTVSQSFLYWTFTAIPAADRIVGAVVVVIRSQSTTGTDVPRQLGWNFYDWTPGGLVGADWRNVYDDPAAALIANAQAFSAGKYAFMGSERLRASVAMTSAQSLSSVTDRQRNLQTPAGPEENIIYSLDESGTGSDPLLIISSLPRCTLSGSLAAQVRLASGGWAAIEMVNGITPRLVFVSAAGTPTTLTDLPIGTSITDYAVTPALSSFALAVDASDNLYVAGKAGGQDNQIQVAAWTKGSGSTWTAPTVWRRAGLPASGPALVNQVAMAWLPVRDGSLFIVAGHQAGEANSGTVSDVATVQMSSAWVRGTSGTSALVTADTTDTLAPPISGSTNRFNAFTNETGTMLDVVRPTGATRSVVTLTTGRNASLTDNDETWVGYAALGDTAGADTLSYRSSDAWGVKDAGARQRVLPISATTVATVTADADTGYGITIKIWQTPATGPWTYLGGKLLEPEALTSMPAAATLARAPIWDAVYNAGANKIYVYYLDAADSRTVRRTGFSLDSYLADRTETTVATGVGPVGAVVQALRADAHDPAGVNGLLTIAHNNSGSNYLTSYVVDSFNLAPYAPSLTPRANYDATTVATFAWTFSDPNAGDTQSAYDFQVLDVALGTLTVNTGWVTSTTASRNVTASTLTNGKTYQWRVRVKDAAGLDGPWSAYGSFATSASGSVTITTPATDNPAGVITDDYQIVWSVSGTTQASYRIVLTRVDTGATVSDTNWVTSTATTALVSGMLSGVEHNVAVQVRNAALVTSGIGNRRITPVYDSPEIPTITVTPVPAEGYVLITVVNPNPTGDRPDASTNLILRRDTGQILWTQVGTCGPDGTFRDYSAGSRRGLEYKVRAVS